MKFTRNWLREYVDVDLDPAVLAERLTMLGLEVEAVERLGSDLSGVRVGRIEAVHPHPNADRLRLCAVRAGQTLHRVVCGAPNVRPGMLVAIALPGAVLPGGFKVKPVTIRGEASEGMLCSERELGLSDEHEGIMELPAGLECGQPLTEALGLEDVLIEVDLTPNRPDCASVIGIAREVAGMVGQRVTLPVRPEETPELTSQGLPFTVAVEAEDCRRYVARLLRNVRIGPSPWWLRQRLLAVGLRPINNVVDVTNFVMMEYGQPLHAFDFARLAGGKIVVRKAVAGEELETLDGVRRQLDPDTLVICDSSRPVAIAGVMGGANSEVTAATRDILIESAWFEPVSIRRTADRLNLSTDSSYRFERGVDPQAPPVAMERAVRLLVELAGGELVADGVDICKGLPEPKPITLRLERVRGLLGMELARETVAAALAGIEIAAEPLEDDILQVHPPSFRVDLEREVDLVEEVARIVGYQEIPKALPRVPVHFPDISSGQRLRRQCAALMTAMGFYEAVNYSFVSPRYNDQLALAADDPARETVRLLNPLTEEQSVLRTSLLPGLLENCRHNINHQAGDLRLFEIGKVFLPRPGQELPAEPERLTAVLTGRRHPGAPLLHLGHEQVDIYDVKGVAEELLAAFRLAGRVELDPSLPVPAYGEPGLCLGLVAGGEPLGGLGQVAGQVLKNFGIKQKVFYLDLDLTGLDRLQPEPKRFAALPRYPAVVWDLAMLVPEATPAGEILAAITACSELIERAEIFDVYRGDKVARGMKSVAFTITYRAQDRTLDDQAVGRVHQRIIDLIVERFHGQLREA